MICATRSRPYFSVHVVDDALAAGDGEVDVHVGHRLAARVEEALEQQVVADRVDVGDLEAVGDEAAGGRAAARADADRRCCLREVDEVPDDQEVVGEAHLLDRLQLVLEPLVQLGVDLAVALLQAFLAELDEVVERVAALGHVGNCGSRIRPSSISTLQRSATSSVRRSASSWPGKSSAISSGVLK